MGRACELSFHGYHMATTWIRCVCQRAGDRPYFGKRSPGRATSQRPQLGLHLARFGILGDPGAQVSIASRRVSRRRG